MVLFWAHSWSMYQSSSSSRGQMDFQLDTEIGTLDRTRQQRMGLIAMYWCVSDGWEFPYLKDHLPTRNGWSFSILDTVLFSLLLKIRCLRVVNSFVTVFVGGPRLLSKEKGGGLVPRFRARYPWGKLTPRPLCTNSLVSGAWLSLVPWSPVGYD